MHSTLSCNMYNVPVLLSTINVINNCQCSQLSSYQSDIGLFHRVYLDLAAPRGAARSIIINTIGILVDWLISRSTP